MLADAAAAGVDAVTIGQYLQPQRRLPPGGPVRARPRSSRATSAGAPRSGLTVVAAPFVRSSYRAGELLERGA